MCSDVLVELHNVGLRYLCKRSIFGNHYHWALEGIDLRLERGDVVGLIGGNGAGKTTLLRIISRVLKPDLGTINTFGNQIEFLAIRSGLNQRLSGRENILLGGVLRGKGLRKTYQNCESVAQYSGIGKFINYTVNKYSAGMQARLGFAISKDANPDVLLLDEIVGVGDAEFKQKSKDLITEKIEKGSGVVIASHSMKTIDEYCNKVCWLEEGKIRCFGNKVEVINDYKNENSKK